jgi:S1-C subfamily serine protease
VEPAATDGAQAADPRTRDARALADVMTADRRAPAARGARKARSPRGANAAAIAPAPPTPAAEVRAAAPRAPSADVHPAAAPGAASAAGGGAVVVSRAELDRALADFAALAAGVRASFSASGLVVDAVGEGTIFERAGLRAGDVVTAVDGVRLRSLDDAANLYARAATARAITAKIVRAGAPATLHVVIQ